jgi:prepilin-type N-terminal cleavage/methylation domain-containing protein
MFNGIGDRKGFTLVELMVVVAIIGILAVIAIPSFMQFRLKAKTAEAKSNLGAIRGTEVAYFAEWNMYVGNQPPTPVLDRTHVPDKKIWVLNTRFSILGFAPENMVFYSYGIDPAVNFPSQSAGYTIYATADLDDNGILSVLQVDNVSIEVDRVGDAF